MNSYQKNLIVVLERLKLEVINDEYLASDLVALLEPFLDDIAADDGFGTERQCDPRGDMRHYEWSLYGKVSGVDYD